MALGILLSFLAVWGLYKWAKDEPPTPGFPC